jgi:hypothetical protein
VLLSTHRGRQGGRQGKSDFALPERLSNTERRRRLRRSSESDVEVDPWDKLSCVAPQLRVASSGSNVIFLEAEQCPQMARSVHAVADPRFSLPKASCQQAAAGL